MPADDPRQRRTPGEPRPRLTPLPRAVGVETEAPRPAPPEAAHELTPVDPAVLQTRKTVKISAAVSGYVALVLLVDYLASTNTRFVIDWAVFQWRLGNIFELAAIHTTLPVQLYAWMQSPLAQGVDLFKLVFWLIVPFCAAIPTMEWAYWRTVRWKSADMWLLAVITIVGFGAMVAIKFVPALNLYYPSRAALSFAEKADFTVTQGFWIFSWLIGYEFLHRYVLLRRFELHFPKYGWLLVPLFDGAYHFSKSWVEMAAMVAFALVLTFWAHKRRNLLLPLTAHFIIEVELLAFLLLF